MAGEEADDLDDEERPICEVLVRKVDQYTHKIDVLTSTDAHSIPLYIPACAPSPTFAIDHLSISWNHRPSSRSCLWYDVGLETPRSLRNSIFCLGLEMGEGQPKLDLGVEAMRNFIEVSLTRQLLVFLA